MLIIYLKITYTKNSPFTIINNKLVNKNMLPCKEGLFKKN